MLRNSFPGLLIAVVFTVSGLGFAIGPATPASAPAHGPNPWWDVCQNGLACDGTTDDSSAFNALVATACANRGGTLWFPPGTTVRLGTAPNHISCGLTLSGAYSKGSAYGYGSFIVCDYTESIPTNACLWWDGANAASKGNGGGITGINVQKGDGKTGGAAIKISGTDCTTRAGNVHIEGVKISSSSGTWNYGVYVDGSSCSTPATQGSRDNYFSDLNVFNNTTKAVFLNNCVHCYFMGFEAAPGIGGNADVDITGSGPGTSASTDVLIAASAMTNLRWDFSSNITCAGCNVIGTFSTTANNASSIYMGVAGAVDNKGAASWVSNDKAFSFGTIQTAQHLISGAADVPSPLPGDVVSDVAGTNGVSGRIFFGHNGNDILANGTLGNFAFVSSAINPSIRLGGNTALFPAWKRNGTAWNARLADDTGDTNIIGASIIANKQTSGATYGTATNCSSSTGLCGSAAAGSVTIPAGTKTIVVHTTAITANSQILVNFDESLGAKLGVQCNTATASQSAQYFISVRSAGTSFTIKTDTSPTARPACLSYFVLN